LNKELNSDEYRNWLTSVQDSHRNRSDQDRLSITNQRKNTIKQKCLSDNEYSKRREEHLQKIGVLSKTRESKDKIRLTWSKKSKEELDEIYKKGKLWMQDPVKLDNFSKKISATLRSPEVNKRLRDGVSKGQSKSWKNGRNSYFNYANNGKKYRSRWEAVFHDLNKHCAYEQLRIPYEINGIIKTYIIDFIDTLFKVVYEVKPNAFFEKNLGNCIEKEYALLKWCEVNGYMYYRITDYYYEDKKDMIKGIVKIDKKLKKYVE
jgi:hypothetical protein